MSTLEVRNLVKDFSIRKGLRRTRLRAVNDVSFTLEPGKTIAVVDWASGLDQVAWLALSPSDGDPGRVTQGVVDALLAGFERANTGQAAHDTRVVLTGGLCRLAASRLIVVSRLLFQLDFFCYLRGDPATRVNGNGQHQADGGVCRATAGGAAV